jgi:hypothetical protein
MATRAHADTELKAVFPLSVARRKDAETSKEKPGGNGLFVTAPGGFWEGKSWFVGRDECQNHHTPEARTPECAILNAFAAAEEIHPSDFDFRPLR